MYIIEQHLPMYSRNVHMCLGHVNHVTVWSDTSTHIMSLYSLCSKIHSVDSSAVFYNTNDVCDSKASTCALQKCIYVVYKYYRNL